MTMKSTGKVVDYLKTCVEPQAVETIRRNAGIGHWDAALSSCFEAMVYGLIKGLKTSKGWVFWVEKEQGTVLKGGAAHGQTRT